MTKFLSSPRAIAPFVCLLFMACSDDSNSPVTMVIDMGTNAQTDVMIDDPDAALADGAQGEVDEPPKVGVTFINIEGAAERTLPTAIWYPADPATQGEAIQYAGFLARDAIEDAPVASGGPWPLIIFSHGNTGVKEQSVFLTEELARAGYIVMAPDHVGNTFFDGEGRFGEIMNHLRPLDVTAVIDRAMALVESDPPWLADKLNLDKIGISGHSRGGYTSLAAVGAALGTHPMYREYCLASETDPVCAEFDPMASSHLLGDDRVIAALPLSPASYTLTAEGLSGVAAPVLIMTGKTDRLTPYDSVVIPIYEALSPPKALWTLTQGDHYTFSDLCNVYDLLPAGSRDQFGSACDPEHPMPPETAHPLIIPVAQAFFDRALKGREDSAGLLTPMVTDQTTLVEVME